MGDEEPWRLEVRGRERIQSLCLQLQVGWKLRETQMGKRRNWGSPRPTVCL